MLREAAAAAASAIVNPRIEEVSERDVRELRHIDASAVRRHRTMATSGGSDAITQPASSDQAFAAIRANADIACCSSSFNAPLCAVPGDQPDGDERQQERGRQLARAECRRPDANQRRKRFADACGRAVQAARLRVGAHRADER